MGRVSFWSDESELNLDGGDDCTNCECTKLHILNGELYGIWIIATDLLK